VVSLLEKLRNLEKILLFTKVVLESIKMDLHTSFAPFWNGTSVNNLLISSNLCFFHSVLYFCAEHLCSFLDQTLCIFVLNIEHYVHA